MLLSQLAVALGVTALCRYGFRTQFPLDLGRRTHHQSSSRHVFGDYSSGCDEGAGSHGDPIQHNRANANQAAIVEGCAVDDGAVANGHIAANQDRFAWIPMQHGTVLNIAPLANADAGEITTGYSCGPEACTSVQLNVSNHDSAGCHPSGIGELGLRPRGSAHGAGVVRVIIFDSPLGARKGR